MPKSLTLDSLDIMLEQSKKLFTQMESGEGVTVVEKK